MRILLLSGANSSHTFKWVSGLSDKGHQILLFSLTSEDTLMYAGVQNLVIRTANINRRNGEGSWSKIIYLTALLQLKRVISDFKPDLLHAHYASSYGLLGALTGFKPFIVSVWGLDIFSFPRLRFLNLCIIRFVFWRANRILSTSNIMAKEVGLYSSKSVEVTPFGIDLNMFKPMKIKSLFDDSDIVIGTVKLLESKYGINYLIQAFHILVKKYPNLPLKLLICGDGSAATEYKTLVKSLELSERTVFTGKVDYKDTPMYHNMLSISVSVSISNSESFGVAIIEASACEKPVVVTSMGGLPEVVNNSVTGYIVPPMDPEATAEAIEKLALDKDLRIKMGKAGRIWVEERYNWKDNLNQMNEIYLNVLYDS